MALVNITAEVAGELEEYKYCLQNLLTIIHRDGGQYLNQHGLKKAYRDAAKIHVELRARMEGLEK